MADEQKKPGMLTNASQIGIPMTALFFAAGTLVACGFGLATAYGELQGQYREVNSRLSSIENKLDDGWTVSKQYYWCIEAEQANDGFDCPDPFDVR